LTSLPPLGAGALAVGLAGNTGGAAAATGTAAGLPIAAATMAAVIAPDAAGAACSGVLFRDADAAEPRLDPRRASCAAAAAVLGLAPREMGREERRANKRSRSPRRGLGSAGRGKAPPPPTLPATPPLPRRPPIEVSLSPGMGWWPLER
jgi:hypothetical protein